MAMETNTTSEEKVALETLRELETFGTPVAVRCATELIAARETIAEQETQLRESADAYTKALGFNQRIIEHLEGRVEAAVAMREKLNRVRLDHACDMNPIGGCNECELAIAAEAFDATELKPKPDTKRVVQQIAGDLGVAPDVITEGLGE